MKKIIFALFVFLCFITMVQAEDYANLMCKYQNSSGEFIYIEYQNVFSQRDLAHTTYKVIRKSNTPGEKDVCSQFGGNSCGTDYERGYDYIQNFINDSELNGIKIYKMEQYITNLNPSIAESLCSKAIFEVKESELVNYIYVCDTSANSRECSISSVSNATKYNYYAHAFGKTGKGWVDYQDFYNQEREKQEKECEKDPNSEACKQAGNNVDLTGEVSEEKGTSAEKLEKSYQDLKTKVDITFEDGTCNAFLGDIGNKNDPAYYLNFSFNLMKYVAILLLLVLTIAEFTKSITSDNQDALKKALQTTIKRIIIAVIIFVLPIIVNFILQILGVVSDNPTCGIGVNNITIFK